MEELYHVVISVNLGGGGDIVDEGSEDGHEDLKGAKASRYFIGALLKVELVKAMKRIELIRLLSNEDAEGLHLRHFT